MSRREQRGGNTYVVTNSCLPCRGNRIHMADCTSSPSCLVCSPFAVLTTKMESVSLLLASGEASRLALASRMWQRDSVPVPSSDSEMPCAVLLVLAPLPSLQGDQDSLLEQKRTWTEPSYPNVPDKAILDQPAASQHLLQGFSTVLTAGAG